MQACGVQRVRYRAQGELGKVVFAAQVSQDVYKRQDQFYTPEASIQNFWGPIADGCSQKNDGGTYTLLEPPEGVSADDHAWDMSTRYFGPKYIPEGFSDKIILPASTSDAQKLELDVYKRQIFSLRICAIRR